MALSSDDTDDLNRRFQSVSLKVGDEAAAYFYRIVGNYRSFLTFKPGPAVTPDKLRSCIRSISDIYKNGLCGTSSRSDWGDADNRRAYIFRFFSMHSYMVYRSLQMSLQDDHLWRYKHPLRVCCLGGGPGSDVVGLVKFLRDTTPLLETSRLRCSIVDLYTDWQTEWNTMSHANPNELSLSVSYLWGDLKLNSDELSALGNLVRAADVITMVRAFSSLSAFLSQDAAHGARLKAIFREMKAGALVLYIDNYYGDRHEEFRRLAQSGGVSECLFEWHGPMSLPSVRHTMSTYQAPGVKPLKRCRVHVMLLRKPGGILGYGPYC